MSANLPTEAALLQVIPMNWRCYYKLEVYVSLR